MHRVDQSWMKWTKCKACGQRYCVNNNELREVRVRRVSGVPVCPSCFGRKGSKELVELYLITKGLAELYSPKGHFTETIPTKKQLKRLAKRAWKRIHGQD